MNEQWNHIDLEAGSCHHWNIGPLQLWVTHRSGEWRTLAEYGGNEDQLMSHGGCDLPAEKEWKRYFLGGGSDRLQLKPVTPDRPVIARPETPIQILPRQEVRFFVGLPIWVQLYVGKKKDTLFVSEVPAMILSNSWFGSPVEGELCYALKTMARRTLEELAPKPFRAICPLIIRNDSAETLNFERLCLRVRHLNIYQGDSHMWTSEGKVVFRGVDSMSQVTFGKDAPAFDGARQIIGKARDDARSFVLRTFDNLKSFSWN